MHARLQYHPDELTRASRGEPTSRIAGFLRLAGFASIEWRRSFGRQPLRQKTGVWLPMIALAAAAWIWGTGSASAQVAPTATDVARYSGLHAAAHRGDLAEIKRLLANGLDKQTSLAPNGLDARDAYGRTAIHIAAHARQGAVIRALAQAGASLELLERDRYDAVTIASVADDEATLRVLLSLGASAKLTTSRYDGTALIAAAHLGHEGVVRQLIAAGAPLDHVNNLHWTALIEAIVLGDGGKRHQAVVQALLQAGASTRLTDREGNTPLALAKSRGYDAMVRMLEKAGAR